MHTDGLSIDGLAGSSYQPPSPLLTLGEKLGALGNIVYYFTAGKMDKLADIPDQIADFGEWMYSGVSTYHAPENDAATALRVFLRHRNFREYNARDDSQIEVTRNGTREKRSPLLILTANSKNFSPMEFYFIMPYLRRSFKAFCRARGYPVWNKP